MANCFSKEAPNRSFIKRFFLPLIVSVVLVAALLFGVSSINNISDADSIRSAREALIRTTVQCYAIEGQYPPNYKYLKEKYGLSIDESKYIVIYRCPMSNMLPEMDVIRQVF